MPTGEKEVKVAAVDFYLQMGRILMWSVMQHLG